MAQVDENWINNKAQEVVMEIGDKLEVADLFKLVPLAMEIVETVTEMSGEEKKDSAVAIMNRVIDELDIPWVPDMLVDPFLKMIVPHVIELVIKATKGEINVNDAKTGKPVEE